ncbi:hypothetical protein ACO0RG_002755 [Hanseniaspora osmophila]|mgnify:FL=1|uniref:Iron transporter FTH1 n=1 Tax=Hanseniaspora osmophila TaxID=56408 RepID=A0A1E5R843_9ASCO|nr:Iron transporter FTH1 [Hanseniaspora osmophila]
MELTNYFSFQIFFIFLRECLEIAIIISILLTIVKQSIFPPESNDHGVTVKSAVPTTLEEEELEYSLQGNALSSSATPGTYSDQESTEQTIDREHLYKKLKVQIFAGGALGLLCCMIIGTIFITIFYMVGTDLWSKSEHYYEAFMSILASLVISIMGIFFLQIGKLKEKFRLKLARAIYKTEQNKKQSLFDSANSLKYTEKYSLFLLPFITALREGLEAVVFLGGVGIDSPLSSIPLSLLAAATISYFFGRVFYTSSTSFSLKICLIVATCLLYIISSGLFSKGFWQFDVQKFVDRCDGQDMTEMGNGPGSYDIMDSVWHVNCCNGERDGFWMVASAILGWTNSATYKSVISYNVYWLGIIAVFNAMKIIDKYGYIPGVPIFLQRKAINKKIAFLKQRLEDHQQQQQQQQQQILGPVQEHLSSFENR